MDYSTWYVRFKRVLPLIVLDSIAVYVCFWVALAFRFDGTISPGGIQSLLRLLPIAILLYTTTNALFGLYHRFWRYTSSYEAMTIGLSTLLSTAVLFDLNIRLGLRSTFPVSVILLGGIFCWGFFTTVRYRSRLLTGLMGRLQHIVGSPDRQRVLIIGAGTAGHLLAQQLKTMEGVQRYELVGLIDDDPTKHGLRTHGVRVLADCHQIPRIVHERSVTLIVIAIDHIEGLVLRDILSICLTTKARIKILPSMLSAIEQQKGVLPLRDIAEEDLLGRPLSAVDEVACRHIIAGKVVLVTGAAGSIGSELCIQVLARKPQLLLMVDNNETGLHELGLTLAQFDPQPARQLVGDVSDRTRMTAIFDQYRPQVVFHAAAYKHVPMMEHHPTEAVRVNILGTCIVAELTRRYASERFVFISTDKAVNPSSIMGATKHIGELLMHARAEQNNVGLPRSRFTAVRFGNVLGSRGSVAPRLIRQIEQGGPITITDPAMTRYFISVSEAVSLVIQAAALTDGGDIFMLDMGQPIRIEDLASTMVRLRGLRLGADIPIVYTGIRPGEKLHEELLATDEQHQPTSHPKIFQIRPAGAISMDDLERQIARLMVLVHAQRAEELSAELWALVADTQAILSPNRPPDYPNTHLAKDESHEQQCR